jgi:hypothetical protein
LSQFVKTDLNVNHVYKLFLALPHLPVDQIVLQFLEIHRCIAHSVTVSDAREALFKLYTYTKNFWIKKIRPERLSTFGSEFRTNNSLESLHKVMKKGLPIHAGIFKFLDAMRCSIFQPHAKVAEQVDNNVHTTFAKGKKKIYQHR